MIGKNALVQIITSLISAILTFFCLSFSARMFGPEIMGNIAYFFGLTGLIFAFSDLGFSRAHVYYSSAGEKLGRYLGTFLSLKLALLLVSTLIAAAYVYLALPKVSWLLFVLVVGAEVFTRLSDSILITFEAIQKSWPQNLVKLAAKAVKLAAIIVLASRMRTDFGYSLSFMIEAALLLTLAIFLLPRFFPLSFNRGLVNKYLLYSLPFFAIVPLSYLQDNSLIVVLKQFRSAAEVGWYSAALNLSGFIKTLYAAVMLYYFPKIAFFHLRHDRQSIQACLDKTVKYLLVVFIPLFIALFTLRKEIVFFVLGQQFLPAVSLFGWLLLGIFILMFLAPYDQILFATKNHRPLVLVNIGTLILVIVSSLVLVPRFGASGAIFTSILAWSFNGFWHLWLIRSRLRLKIFPSFLNFIVPGLAIFAVACFVANYLPSTLMVKLLLAGLSCTAYLITLVLIGLVGRADWHYLKSLIKP